MIHPSAIVHPDARIGNGVEIGPYSIIGADVEIGDECRIGPHVVIEGNTRIGRENRIFQFCSIGAAPRDKKYDDEPTRLVIGDRNTIREYCSFNLGTSQDLGVTTVGDDNWIMAYVQWPMTAWLAITRSSPITRPWPAMCRSATGPSSADSRVCISSDGSVPTRFAGSVRC